jgi:type I restriction enzyme R subunit
MREALPNATFVGFTGTPLERDDKNTLHVFGDYVDVYDIRPGSGGRRHPAAVLRVAHRQTQGGRGWCAGGRGARWEYIVNADRDGESPDERIRVQLESLVGAPERLERLAAFIVEHWEKRRAAMEGKAMVVTMSRDIAARLYEQIRLLRPAWHDADDERGAMKVVVTGSTEDPEPFARPCSHQGGAQAVGRTLQGPGG